MLDAPYQRCIKPYYDPTHLSNCRLDDEGDQDSHEERYCSQSSEVRGIRHVQMAYRIPFAITRLLLEHARETG